MPLPALPFALPWKWIGVGVGALIIVSTVFFSIRAYGNAQFDAGEAKADAAWEAAAEELEEQADTAALVATAEKEIRDADFDESQADLKEGIDDAKTDDLVGAGTRSYYQRLRDQKNSDSD